MAAITYALSEMAVRDALRLRTDLVTFLNNDATKIDIDYRGSAKTFINVWRSGGFPSRYITTDRAIMTFHCYGTTRKVALDLATLLAGVLHDFDGHTYADTYFYDAVVQSHFYLPDNNHARYVITALIRTRPA